MMTRTIFTFDTTHHALWAEEIARELGIAHDVVPAPPEAHARCNIALEALEEDVPTLSSEMDRVQLSYRLYRALGSGL